MACGKHAITAALYGQRKLIDKEIHEKRVEQKKYFLNIIPEGEPIDFDTNTDTVILKKGLAHAVGYSKVYDPFPDTCDGPQTTVGTLPGQKAMQDQCGSTDIETQVGQYEENACDGVTEIGDYGQGWEFRSSEDVEVKLTTKERCIKTLMKREQKHVREYIDQEKDYLIETAYLTKDREIRNLIVKNSGANSVVKRTDHGDPQLTAGGWNFGSDPNGFLNSDDKIQPLSIYWLERYRQQIVDLLVSATVPNADNYVMQIPITRDAWRLALAFEGINRNSDHGLAHQLRDQIRIMRNERMESTMPPESAFSGMGSDTWMGKIRAVFVEDPPRFIVVPTDVAADGSTIFSVLQVAKYFNRAVENGAGIETVVNPDYTRNNFVYFQGKKYPIMEGIAQVHPDSFKMHRINQGYGPDGVTPLNNDFSIQLLTGSDLSSSDCPNYGDFKYKYYMENMFRFVNCRNEFSGMILHRRVILPGYNIDVDELDLTINEGSVNGQFEDCEAGEEKFCNPECEPEVVCDATTNVTRLFPCGGVVKTAYTGISETVVKIALDRDSDCADDPALIEYGIIDDTALKGVHYEHVDADGNILGATGQVSYEAGESGGKCSKFIYIKIIGALDPTVIEDCCASEAEENLAKFTVKLTGATGTNLDNCTELDVLIQNLS